MIHLINRVDDNILQILMRTNFIPIFLLIKILKFELKILISLTKISKFRHSLNLELQ